MTLHQGTVAAGGRFASLATGSDLTCAHFRKSHEFRTRGQEEPHGPTSGGGPSDNKQSLLAPATRSRPFGTSALRSRRLLSQATRPPADVRDLERYRQAEAWSGKEQRKH
jgi:hypothetical protein